MSFWDVLLLTLALLGCLYYFLVSPKLKELQEQLLKLKGAPGDGKLLDGSGDTLNSLARKYRALRQEVSELKSIIERLSSTTTPEKADLSSQLIEPSHDPILISKDSITPPVQPDPRSMQPAPLLHQATPFPVPIATNSSPLPQSPSRTEPEPASAVPTQKPRLEHSTAPVFLDPSSSVPGKVVSEPTPMGSNSSSMHPELPVYTRKFNAQASSARMPASKSTQQAGKLFDLEEALGTNWLLKIGMTLVVVGIALFLGYSVHRLGAWGKVTLGVGVSLAVIVGGWRFERRKGYETFGRVLLSGGWGLAYFTAYAMRYIEATRVLSSDGAGFMAMLLVAVGMVAQSLKYRSQFVTGFAYGLSYLTLIISPVEWHTLLASALLALSIVLILRQLGWYALEGIAVISTYAIHFMWLHPIISQMGQHKQPFPEYRASVALLALYWLSFVASHFLRRGQNQSQKSLLQFALILNSLGYVGLSGYQSVHPQWAFGFLLGLGLVYWGLAYLSHHLNRRDSYLLTSTIGAILVVAAIPYKFSSNHLMLLWLLECEMFLIAGFRLREIHFRRLAWLTSTVLASYLGYHYILPRFNEPGETYGPAGLILLVGGLAFMLNTLFLSRIYNSEVKSDLERFSIHAYLYIGWLVLISALWFLSPSEWLLLIWLSFGILLYETYCRLSQRHLDKIAILTVGLAIVRAAWVNLPDFFNHRGWNLEAGLMVGTIILLYLFSENVRRISPQEQFAGMPAPRVFDAHSYIAWVFLIVTGWLALSWVWLCVVLAVMSCLLHLAGISLGEKRLKIQAQLTALLAAFRYFYVNFPNDGAILGMRQRVFSGIAVALLLYAYGELSRRSPLVQGDEGASQKWINVPAANLILVFLMWREFAVGTVALGWGLLALSLIEIGQASRRRDFERQGHIMAAITFFRLVVANLELTGNFGWVSIRLLTISPLIALFYYLFVSTRSDPYTRRTKGVPLESSLSEVYLYFGLISLLAVLRFELPMAWVAAGWAVVSVVLMILGRYQHMKTFRYQSTFVTLMVLVRCVFENLSLTNEVTWMNLRLISTASVIAIFMFGFMMAKLLRTADSNSASIHLKHKLALSLDKEDFMVTENGIMALAREGIFLRALRACDQLAHHFFFFAAVGLVTALIQREMAGSDYFTVGWAVEAIFIFMLALLLKERSYRLFAMALMLACTVKIFLFDIWVVGATSQRVICIGAVAMILFIGFMLTRVFTSSRQRSLETSNGGQLYQTFGNFDRSTQHYFFYSTVGLITLLIWREVTGGGYLTASWALEALVVFMLAVLLNERAYRLLGMILLLACTAKIILFDVWRLYTLERIIAFIVLGAVLVLVSFYYTRYRESWRGFLLGH